MVNVCGPVRVPFTRIGKGNAKVQTDGLIKGRDGFLLKKKKIHLFCAAIMKSGHG